MQDIAKYIDHTILKPETTGADIEKLCNEAITYGFVAVCVPPYYVTLAKSLLHGSGIRVATVIGFPIGYSSTASKLQEIEDALAAGADELDVVHNIAAVKNKDWAFLESETAKVTEAVHEKGKLVKIIIESGLLSDEEIINCCKIYSPDNPDFIKTSTGYAHTGATLHAVELMRQHLPANIAIKASGGIRNFAFAQELIQAGATRLGCSAGADIIKESNLER